LFLRCVVNEAGVCPVPMPVERVAEKRRRVVERIVHLLMA
jgi:hypothetical protein